MSRSKNAFKDTLFNIEQRSKKKGSPSQWKQNQIYASGNSSS
jgi:hypothetical protein